MKLGEETSSWSLGARIVCWSVVRTSAFHSFLTSSTEIDEIVGSRGFCKAVKGISEDEFVGLHKVKVCLLVVVLRLDFIRR
jgi:hypothetical protein